MRKANALSLPLLALLALSLTACGGGAGGSTGGRRSPP